MRKDKAELQLVANSLSVATSGAKLRKGRGSLVGAKRGSDSDTSDHDIDMRWMRKDEKGDECSSGECRCDPFE